jgi:hypothetical protein
MMIRPNRWYSSQFRINSRGLLLITKNWVIATGTFARVYGS